MKQILFLLVNCSLLLLVYSCGQENDTNKKLKKAIQKKQPATQSTISDRCAIIISPTEHTIDSLKKAYGENFYAISDDNLFYIGTASIFLDSTKTKTIDRDAEGFIQFKLDNGKIDKIDLSEFYWGIILFNGHTAPIEADITTFESEFRRYMEEE